jgi:hypothetical protein
MTRDPVDDLLDQATPLPDDGFTARVMSALPPARSAPRPLERWLRWLAIGVSAVVLAPEVGGLARSLAGDSARLGDGLARALAAAGRALPAEAGLLAAVVALAGAVLGAWLVADPG